MKAETIRWGVLMLLLAGCVGLLSARAITNPIQQLADSTQLIARGDFSKKIQIRSRTEIGELAETFNKMTDDLELYIRQIRKAGEENKALFLGTIRALAAAVDEKDPYTRGHSDRVTKYSVIIARALDLDEKTVETISISALLHDVGKIGIDDKILKKPGFLTPEEFEIMKQHPVKGFNIIATANKPLKTAAFVHNEKTVGPWKVDGEKVSGQLSVWKDGTYRLELTDNHGFGNPSPPRHEIRAIKDETPTVHINRPGTDMELVPNGNVPLLSQAIDDYGITRMNLVYVKSRGEA
jgi:HAMP domain-containing protein